MVGAFVAALASGSAVAGLTPAATSAPSTTQVAGMKTHPEVQVAGMKTHPEIQVAGMKTHPEVQVG